MTFRSLTALAVAALAAAVPAVASAKPHGPGHPGHGVAADAFERFQRAERELVSAEEAEPVTDETAPIVEEPVADKSRPAKKAKHTRGRGRGRAKGKMTVFKGRIVSVDAATSTVVVRIRHRNRWARIFRGEEVAFSLETARVQVADTDGDGTQGVADIAAADRVVVKARVARGAADDGTPIAALRLIDLSSPEDEDDEDEVVEPAPVEPDPVATEPAPEV